MSDVDASGLSVTLTLSDVGAGTLSTGTSGAVTSTFSAGVWNATGAISSINILLASVTFTPSSDYSSNFSITTSVSDGVASATTGSKSMTAFGVNDAPVLDTSKSPTLSSVEAGAGAPSGAVGTLVSSLVDFDSPAGQVDNITEVDTDALLGIAITNTDTVNFTCYYTINGGSTWASIGAVSPTSARIIAADADNRIYCQPLSGDGSFSDVLTFRAWDQTSGSDGGLVSTATSGGTSAFSSSTDGVDVVVSAIELDTTDPDTIITVSSASSIDASSAIFEFISDEDSVTFECSVDTEEDPEFTTCTSPFEITSLVQGDTYTFSVRAKDASDNSDLTPAQATWTVSNMSVVSIVPSDGATRVSINAPLVITFDAVIPEPLRDALTVESSPCDESCPQLTGIWSEGNTVLTYTNNESFARGTTFTIEAELDNGLTTGTIFSTSFTTTSMNSTVVGSSVRVAPRVIVEPISVTPVSITSVYHFPRMLKFGMQGDDVVVLQKFLGITPPPSKHFGPLTKAKLVEYQKSHGLDPDGIAGPKTFAVIEAEMSS